MDLLTHKRTSFCLSYMTIYRCLFWANTVLTRVYRVSLAQPRSRSCKKGMLRWGESSDEVYLNVHWPRPVFAGLWRGGGSGIRSGSAHILSVRDQLHSRFAVLTALPFCELFDKLPPNSDTLRCSRSDIHTDDHNPPSSLSADTSSFKHRTVNIHSPESEFLQSKPKKNLI